MNFAMWVQRAALAMILTIGMIAFAQTADAARGAREGLQVTVDVDGQVMEVYVDGRLRHRWPVSTGRDGYDTPSGTYRPQRLEKLWFSKQYDDAPMPNAVFFHQGYAIHGTNETRRLGNAASHGCVRLAPGHAAKLFSLVEGYGPAGTKITINNDGNGNRSSSDDDND